MFFFLFCLFLRFLVSFFVGSFLFFYFFILFCWLVVRFQGEPPAKVDGKAKELEAAVPGR